MNREAAGISESDVDVVRRAGWSAEAIYDAVNVCGLFNFFNRWVDATGVHEMSPEAYALAGKRLARRGYNLEASVE